MQQALSRLYAACFPGSHPNPDGQSRRAATPSPSLRYHTPSRARPVTPRPGPCRCPDTIASNHHTFKARGLAKWCRKVALGRYRTASTPLAGVCGVVSVRVVLRNPCLHEGWLTPSQLTHPDDSFGRSIWTTSSGQRGLRWAAVPPARQMAASLCDKVAHWQITDPGSRVSRSYVALKICATETLVPSPGTSVAPFLLRSGARACPRRCIHNKRNGLPAGGIATCTCRPPFRKKKC